MGPEAYWSWRTCLSHCPAPRPTKKRPCATIVRSVGCMTNTNPAAGHTSVSRVRRCTDLVGCLLVLVAVGRGCLTWIPGSQHSYRARQDGHPQASLRGAVPQALSLIGRASFIAFFRGILTGSEAFLEPPSMSGLRRCARTHLKKALCHIHPAGGTYAYDKSQPGTRRRNIYYLSRQYGVCVLTTKSSCRTWGLRPYPQPKHKTWNPTNHSCRPSTAYQTNHSCLFSFKQFFSELISESLTIKQLF